MDDVQRRINDIEKEMRDTPYHKGTEGYIGLLRARLAKLKDQLLESGVKKGGGGGSGFALKKHGDATVVLVGFPSVGKSTLLNALTNANSPTADYDFTTVSVIPGILKYKSARIQILDVPGLIEGAALGKGRGREVLSVVRGADLLLLIASIGHEQDLDKIKDELYTNGVRINQTPPNITVQKLAYGGMRINSSVKQDLNRQTILDICKEFRLVNTEVNIKEKVSIDRLIDSFATNRIFVPAVSILTKIDQAKRTDILKHDNKDLLGISASTGEGLDELKEAFWNKLGFARVYLKRSGKEVDFEEPMIMRIYDTIGTVAQKVGTEFASDIKEAKIWGTGARFPGQLVSLKTSVQDEMIVMFV